MSFRRLIALAWLFSIPIVLSCAGDDDSPVGYDWLDWNSDVYTVILYPTDAWQDTYFDCYVNTGRDVRLLVGRFDHYLFRSLIMFRPQDLDFGADSDITGARIRLAMEKEVGVLNDAVYNQGGLEIEVAPLYVSWGEGDATWYHADHYTEWDGGIFGAVEGIAYAQDAEEDITYVDIEITDLCRDWVADPNNNFGVIIKARDENQQVVKEFYSLDILTREGMPKLTIEYQENGEKKSVTIPPAIDCFIATSDEHLSDSDVCGYEDIIKVGGFNGYSFRSPMFFDVSEEATGIPNDATVVLAELKLYYHPNSKGEEAVIRAYKMLEFFDESMNRGTLAPLDFDPEESYGSMQIEGAPAGYQSIYINQLVQDWISGTAPNYGLLLAGDEEDEDKSFALKFSSLNEPDSSFQPYLIVKFTLAPGSYFPQTDDTVIYEDGAEDNVSR